MEIENRAVVGCFRILPVEDNLQLPDLGTRILPTVT
jgi:hypothetical protein